jgi:CcmD family protein
MTHDLAHALQAQPSADDRSTEFVAVDPQAASGAEHYSGSTLLVSAYIAIWVILMGWILMMWRKQGALSVRLDDLEKTLDRAAAAAEKQAKKA